MRWIAERGPCTTLSPRELQVLAALARGETMAETAKNLGICAQTVDKHREAVRRKSGRKHVAALTMLALKLKLVELR